MNLSNNMKSNPLLSVVIPVYGTASTLPRCLESLLKCTYKNIEIIVVNDASPDNASEIVKSYAEQDKRVHLVEHERNMGLYLARIAGVKVAQGEYLAFLDSDDYVSVDFYRRLIEKAQKSDSDMVIGEIYLQNKNIYTYLNLSHVRLLDIDAKDEDASNLLFDQEGMDFTLCVVWNKIYRVDLLNRCIQYITTHKYNIFYHCDILFYSVLYYFSRHITNIHGDFVYHVQNNKKINCISYREIDKNIDYICNIFSLLKCIFCDKLHEYKYWNNILKWKELILSEWWDNIEIAEIPIWKKHRIQSKLMDCFKRESLKRQRSKSFFYSVSTNSSCILHEILKKSIVDQDIQIVSFDTLVYRPFWNPTDLFYFLGQYAENVLGVSDILDFSTLRIEAENKAREIAKYKTPAREDIILDEIYSVLADELDATPEQIEQIKYKEIQLEIQYCHPRKYAKELFDLALATGKRVVITSDMYLTRDVVEKILANCGYTGYEFLFLSSEVGLTKASGHLFSYVAEKMHAVAREKYKNLNFMARDGYLPMECYKIIDQIYKNKADLHYLYLTRSVMVPLQVQKQNDFYGLERNINIFSQTPLSLIELIEPVLVDGGKSEILKICRENGYHSDKRFSSIASFYHFINLIRGVALDKLKTEQYKEKIRAYLEPAFNGKSATFDVGYSCRVEATLKKVFKFCITPYYIHINNQLPYSRAHRMNLNFQTFYSYSPGVTGVLRELLMSKQSPSCLCLNVENDKVVPVFKKYNQNYEEKFVISIIQEKAIQLVKDVVAMFGNDIVMLNCQHEDISLAFEYFMSKPRTTDQKLFALGNFEDDLGIGGKISTYDVWNRQVKSIANGFGNEIDLSFDWIHSKWKRAICLYFLNRNYLKRKVKEHMREHQIMLMFLVNSYKLCRKVYRTINHCR